MDYVKVIDTMFDYIKRQAVEKQICKRKACGCAIMLFGKPDEVVSIASINGPSSEQNICTNEIGNCGCAHAEPRAILSFLRQLEKDKNEFVILITTYSSCIPCANLIVECGFIDAVVYDVFAPHWARADVILKNVMPVWTRAELTNKLIERLKK